MPVSELEKNAEQRIRKARMVRSKLIDASSKTEKPQQLYREAIVRVKAITVKWLGRLLDILSVRIDSYWHQYILIPDGGSLMRICLMLSTQLCFEKAGSVRGVFHRFSAACL